METTFDLFIGKVEAFKWVCPTCETTNLQLNDPEYVGSVFCEHCNIQIKLGCKQSQPEN